MRLPLSISKLRGKPTDDNPIGYARIMDADGRFVFRVELQADAEFIVRSVNATFDKPDDLTPEEEQELRAWLREVPT